MEQARLIQRLKKMHGIKNGKNNSSRKMREEAKALGIIEDTANRFVNLNKLIPPLQAESDGAGAVDSTVEGAV